MQVLLTCLRLESAATPTSSAAETSAPGPSTGCPVCVLALKCNPAEPMLVHPAGYEHHPLMEKKGIYSHRLRRMAPKYLQVVYTSLCCFSSQKIAGFAEPLCSGGDAYSWPICGYDRQSADRPDTVPSLVTFFNCGFVPLTRSPPSVKRLRPQECHHNHLLHLVLAQATEMLLRQKRTRPDTQMAIRQFHRLRRRLPFQTGK